MRNKVEFHRPQPAPSRTFVSGYLEQRSTVRVGRQIWQLLVVNLGSE